MNLSYIDEFKRWKTSIDENESLYAELLELETLGESEIEECFYKDIEFGTGGLRGIRGAGTNRLNIYTVARASQGVANYMIKNGIKPFVAIAYDTRINSKLFAQTAAEVFCANGIRVFMYDDYSTVPQLSFAVRKKKCGMGIILTASHNPSEYNGYKVYCSDGYQITDYQAKAIYEEIKKVDIFSDVKRESFRTLEAKGRVEFMGEKEINEFIDEVIEALPTKIDEKEIGKLSVVYTPLNGAGSVPVRKMLKKIGVTELYLVEEQMNPDGNFPTCPYPNPEIKETMALAEKLANEKRGEIIFATDPDCDRVGVAVRTKEGFEYLSGNQIGILLLDFILKCKAAENTLPKEGKVATTIVSAKLADEIAAEKQLEVVRSLIGFKYIGEYITELEKNNKKQQFVFGFEESYGYLTGSHVRDKDGVNAVAAVCQMAAFYKTKGKNLADVLESIYKKHGYEEDLLLNFTFKGKAGAGKMQEIMRDLREKDMPEIAGCRLTKKADYKTRKSFAYDENGIITATEDINLPESNIIEYEYTHKISFTVRPSGTEPKIKVYIFTRDDDKEKVASLSNKVRDELRRIIKDE